MIKRSEATSRDNDSLTQNSQHNQIQPIKTSKLKIMMEIN